MLAGPAAQPNILPGVCQGELQCAVRAARTTREIRSTAEVLLSSLADCADYTRIRVQLWLLAESGRLAEGSGDLEHSALRPCYDLLGVSWALCERMETAWRLLDQGETSQAIAAAGRAGDHLTELEGHSFVSRTLLECLRARCRATWHIADALDEASFLADCGDHTGARTRADQLLDQLTRLDERGVLSPDELVIAQLAAARWGARPRGTGRGSLAS